MVALYNFGWKLTQHFTDRGQSLPLQVNFARVKILYYLKILEMQDM